MNKFRIFNTIAFVIFCLAIGHAISTLLTSLVFDVSALQIMESLRDPFRADRSLILLPSLFYSVFSFIIIPGGYLLIRDKSSLRYLWITPEMKFMPFMLSVLMVLCIIPLVTMLIELNEHITFPVWLADLEGYFKESEERARLLTNSLLLTENIGDLITIIFVVAIIPGVAEEFFFRGLVQKQLNDILKNQHQAILLSAFLFSLLHFQFYGFIPRMLLGILFGYLFMWSKNILYPVAAHVANNLVGVLGSFFHAQEIINPERGLLQIVFVFFSTLLTISFILYFKKTGSAEPETPPAN